MLKKCLLLLITLSYFSSYSMETPDALSGQEIQQKLHQAGYILIKNDWNHWLSEHKLLVLGSITLIGTGGLCYYYSRKISQAKNRINNHTKGEAAETDHVLITAVTEAANLKSLIDSKATQITRITQQANALPPATDNLETTLNDGSQKVLSSLRKFYKQKQQSNTAFRLATDAIIRDTNITHLQSIKVGHAASVLHSMSSKLDKMDTEYEEKTALRLLSQKKDLKKHHQNSEIYENQHSSLVGQNKERNESLKRLSDSWDEVEFNQKEICAAIENARNNK